MLALYKITGGRIENYTVLSKRKHLKGNWNDQLKTVTLFHRQGTHKYNKGRNLYIQKHTLHPNSYENQRNSITRSYLKATYSPCRKNTWFWLVRKHFCSGCLWEFYLKFSQNFLSKAWLKHFPMDNHTKTICGYVRSEWVLFLQSVTVQASFTRSKNANFLWSLPPLDVIS